MSKTETREVADLPTVATVEEVRQVLRYGRCKMYDLVAEGKIRSIREGRLIRIPRAAVQEFLDNASGKFE